MTDTPNPSISAPAAPAPASAGNAPSGGLRRTIIIAAGGLIGLIALLFVCSVIIALTTDIEQSGTIIRLIRDLVIIFLALEGILIVLSLAILILQVARLVNLLQTEIKPILENTQQTVKTAQTTVEFVSANLTQPVVRLSGFLAGTSVVLREAFGLRKAIRKTAVNDEQKEARG
ncbi:MAG: hypothetical protein SF162_14560 [bacterium]|nr:hypothetical protein [bacterium]